MKTAFLNSLASERIDALESAFQDLGIDLYNGAQRLAPWLDRFRSHVGAAQSRETLEDYLSTLEVKPEEARMMALLVAAAPGLLAASANFGIVTAAKQIPGTPGRPDSTTPEMHRSIVERIYVLNRAKVPIGLAQERCAQEFGISKRTVQSLWSRRDQLQTQPLQTVSDLWKVLS